LLERCSNLESSNVIDDLVTRRSSQNLGLAFFYFDYKSPDAQKPTEVVKSLIRQLADRVADLTNTELEILFCKYRSHESAPELSELLICLDSLPRYFDSTFIILDALDEIVSKERAALVDALAKCSRTSIKVLATSRPDLSDVEDLFKRINAEKLEIRSDTEDIKNYLKEKIPHATDSPFLRDRIKESLTTNDGNCL